MGAAASRHGVAILPAGRRSNALAQAVEGIPTEDFASRILGVDSAAAPEFVQIATIARAHGATRRVCEFDGCGIGMIDPLHHVNSSRGPLPQVETGPAKQGRSEAAQNINCK